MCVLYIADTSEEIETFSEVMQSLNPYVQCYFARDTDSALDIVSSIKETPAYIFLDLNEKRIDGKGFITTLRQLPNGSNAQLILYTSASDPEAVEECTRLGAIDIQSKPSGFREVYQQLTKFIALAA